MGISEYCTASPSPTMKEKVYQSSTVYTEPDDDTPQLDLLQAERDRRLSPPARYEFGFTPISVKSASTGVRAAIAVFNLLLLIIGITLIALSSHMSHVMNLKMAISHRPSLAFWILGVPPLLVSVTGLATLATQRRKMMAVWLCISPWFSIGGFLYFSFAGMFDTASLGITLHIFGHCIQRDLQCVCYWENSSQQGVIQDINCSATYHVTTLYLLVICLVIFGLACHVICVVLVCIYTCCIEHCMPRVNVMCGRNPAMNGINIRGHPPEAALLLTSNFLLLPRNTAMCREALERQDSIDVIF